MANRQLSGWLAVFLVVLVGAASIVAARSIGSLRDRGRITQPQSSTSSQPSPSPIPTNPETAADKNKPNYEGPLGDFIVGVNQPSSLPPCPRPIRSATNEKIKSSELYSPVFGENLEGEVGECADGKIIAIEVHGEEIISKAYFVGKPNVPYEAPLERLRLIIVAGKPAILQLPIPGFPGTLRLGVIERFPKGNQYGILVFVEFTMKSQEEAIQLAIQMMGGGKQ